MGEKRSKTFLVVIIISVILIFVGGIFAGKITADKYETINTTTTIYFFIVDLVYAIITLFFWSILKTLEEIRNKK